MESEREIKAKRKKEKITNSEKCIFISSEALKYPNVFILQGCASKKMCVN